MRSILLGSIVIILVLSLACSSQDNSLENSIIIPENQFVEQQKSKPDQLDPVSNIFESSGQITESSPLTQSLVQPQIAVGQTSANTQGYTPKFEGQFEFELSTGLQINNEDVLTGRPVFMLSVSEY